MLAVLRSESSVPVIQEAVDELGGTLETRIETIQDLVLKDEFPEILLVEVDFTQARSLEQLASLVQSGGHQMTVLVTAQDASMHAVRRLMQLGVPDLLPMPIEKSDVVEAINTALNRLVSVQDSSQSGKVMSFIRGSGSTGCSTLALQAAVDISSRGKKAKPSVCLVDFDLQFGNLAFALDLTTRVSLYQILENPQRLDTSFLQSSVTTHKSGIDVLAAPPRIVPLEAMTMSLAGDVVELAREIYDYVVIDMPQAWTVWTEGVLTLSDNVSVVAVMDVATLQKTRRIFDLMQQEGLDDLPITVLLNRFERNWGWRRLVRKAEDAIGRKVDCLIGNDWETAHNAAERGSILRDVKKNSVIERDLREFLDQMMANWGDATEGETRQFS
jgi:pilus assembly protein CpaE